jgi:pilus assembly protein CpaB
MPVSRLIVLGVAVAAAGGAGLVAKKLAVTPPQRVVVNAPHQPELKLKQVLVVTDDVPIGGTLSNQMRWQSWPADGLDQGFVTRDKEPDAVSKLKGSLLRAPMYKGEPVRLSKLVGQGKNLMASILPKGMRAVATQISAETSAGGFILPNDRVDVIMTRRASKTGVQGGGASGYITETILHNIRVLAIDQTIQEDEHGKKTKVGTTATLELTPEQAEIITVAQQMADKLTLALRSVKDDQQKAKSEADYLVSGNGRRGTIRMVKAGDVSEVQAR